MRFDGMGLDRIGWNEMRALLPLKRNKCMYASVCLSVRMYLQCLYIYYDIYIYI